jgi:hypothetical protein
MGICDRMAQAVAVADVTEPGFSATEPGPGASEVDDRLLRLIAIPGFGLIIPQATGLYGPHRPFGPGAATFWLGTAWFIVLAFIIWHANRWLLFKTREHTDWFAQPGRKIMLLLFGVAFGTIPVTVAMLVAWYQAAGFTAPDWGRIQTITLVNVICVVFVTHVYETVFLIKAREDDRLRTVRLSRARIESELEALRAQIDPHFLFNSLNTLLFLIRESDGRAAAFTEKLARVTRYLIACRGRQLVLLTEELDFTLDYGALMALRFGDALSLRCDLRALRPDRYLVPPVSLQLLVENAVKHNEVSEERPLEVVVRDDGPAIVVTNRKAPRSPTASPGLGLRNLAERVRLTGGGELVVNGDGDAGAPLHFTVRLPLLPV